MHEDKHKLQALIDHLHHEIDEIENTKMIIMESNNQKLIDMESALQQKDMESYQMKVVKNFFIIIIGNFGYEISIR